MMVIGIVGSKASGKDTIARYIENKYSAAIHAHSEILEEILQVLFIPNSRDNTIKLVALRDVFGKDVLINALNKKIKSDQNSMVIVTGIRFENELQNIRNYPNNKIIFVTADLKLRYQRQHERNEKADDAKVSFDKFLEVENAVTERNVNTLGGLADYKIENNGSEEELYARVDQILKAIV
jgi:dephospho-CoA kinase